LKSSDQDFHHVGQGECCNLCGVCKAIASQAPQIETTQAEKETTQAEKHQ